MLNLFFLVVGEGSIFSVEIGEGKSVDALKKAIKKEKKLFDQYDADKLTIYLAKKDGHWLLSDDDDVSQLRRGDVPMDVRATYFKPELEMNPNSLLRKYFSDENIPKDEEYHGLVLMPLIAEAFINEELHAVAIPHPDRKRRWDALNEVLDMNRKTKKGKNEKGEVVYFSTGYSYVSWNEVELILSSTPYKQKSKEINKQHLDVTYAYLLQVTKAFGTIVTGKEAKRMHFLAPIFVCVCSLLGDVQILAEETIEGKRVHADGSFEFVIRRGKKRICIVEAKRDNLRQGMAQNLIGCEALADVEGLNIVYGIVTNYKQWYFFRSLDSRIERDESTIHTSHDIPTRESVKDIAGRIYAMLLEE
jgi:hypothetical protein